jgi:cupin 2 domain-containing protein
MSKNQSAGQKAKTKTKEDTPKTPLKKQVKNIFKRIPSNMKEEFIEALMEAKDVKIERIVSKGHSSPPGHWFNQDRDEYVILLKGSAGILFEGKDDVTIMGRGDYLNIPANVKHRVEWTDTKEETVWLAVYY